MVRTLIIVLLLLTATAAPAAPTCQTQSGDTIRCGTDGAMPVRWTAPPKQWHPRATGSGAGELAQVVIVLVLFFAMIALMPSFDGRRTSDWHRQDDDPRE